MLIYGRPVRPVPVPRDYSGSGFEGSETYPYLPNLQALLPEKKETERLIFPVARATGKVSRKIGRSIRKTVFGPNEQEKNETVLKGLRYQFNQDRVNAIVDESFSEYQSHNPDLNRPELYELYETGIVDNVLDRKGVRWVVGRPKLKR